MTTADRLLSGLLARAADDPRRLLSTASRSYGAGDFVAGAGAIVERLRAVGFVRGDRVVLYLEEYDTFFAAMIAVWLAGGVAVPINTSLPLAEAAKLVERARAAVVVAHGGAPHLTERCPRIVLDEVVPASRMPALSPLQPNELAIILYTSGTTGRPKGVCQTLASVTGNAERVAAALGLAPDDRIFINTPPYFTSGICHFLTLAAAGGSLHGHAGLFFGEGLLSELTSHGCTGFGGAPAHLIRVLAPLTEPQRIPGLRFWVSSGDHLPQEIIDKAAAMLPGVALFNMYGLTEVSGRLCILPPAQAARRRGSVGKPIADMRVVACGPNGRELPPGAVGELCVSGPLLMTGYLDDPEATAAALGPHGFRTGDYGHVDKDGYVWVEGRKDDIFKRGGEKVSTVQIQQAILALGMVADAAVLAVPDESLGHVPVAFVAPGAQANFKRTALLRSLRDVLPASSLPARVVTVEAIPRTGSGKAIRGELLALLEKTASPSPRTPVNTPPAAPPTATGPGDSPPPIAT
jgi:acyl-CoA synthetase (AMP-forming)/AMP-acid ligase II